MTLCATCHRPINWVYGYDGETWIHVDDHPAHPERPDEYDVVFES